MQYEKAPEENEILNEEMPQKVKRAAFVFPLYSIILIACLVVIWLCQVAVDGSNSVILGGKESVDLAGFDKQVFLSGEYWRILTGAALHGGLIHLAFNCYALYILGKIIETLSNRAHLAIMFLLSAIGGGILSLIFLPNVASIGASGGIVGFLGYLTVYGYKRRKLLTNAFLKNMVFNIVFIAFIGIAIIPNVDNFGHLGGLLAGAAYGLIQIPSDIYKDPRTASEMTDTIGKVALGTFIIVSLFTVLILFQII